MYSPRAGKVGMIGKRLRYFSTFHHVEMVKADIFVPFTSCPQSKNVFVRLTSALILSALVLIIISLYSHQQI